MQDIAIRTAVAIQSLAARLREREEGQTAVEYAGILALIALIFVALFGLNLDNTIKGVVSDAVNDITGK
jgi:Flp pilus assembly pilin Flp